MKKNAFLYTTQMKFEEDVTALTIWLIGWLVCVKQLVDELFAHLLTDFNETFMTYF